MWSLLGVMVLCAHGMVNADFFGLPTPRFAIGPCSGTNGNVNNMVDVVGTGHTLTLAPSTATGISVVSDSVRGRCLQRSSTATSGAGVNIANSAPAASYTKALWVRVISTTSTPNFMSAQDFTASNEVGAHFLGLGPTGDIYAAHNTQASSSKRYSVQSEAGTVALGTWYHVVVSFNSSTGTMRVYRNGQETIRRSPDPSDATPVGWVGTSAKLTQFADCNGKHMQGCMTDMELWDVELTGTQIASLYTQQLTTNVCNETLPALPTPPAPYTPPSAPKFPSGVPPPRLALGVCNTTLSDIVDVTGNGHTISVYPMNDLGVSVVFDPDRGQCLSRTTSAAPIASLVVSDSSPAASYTKSLWVKATSIAGFPSFMSSFSVEGDIDADTGSHFFGLNDNGQLYAAHTTVAGNDHYQIEDDTNEAPILDVDTWYHVVATYNNETQILIVYLNGVEVARREPAPGDAIPVWAGSDTNSRSTQIGNSLSSHGLEGCVSDMILWDIPLNATQVANLYTRQSHVPNICPWYAPRPIFLLRVTETQAVDVSGNGRIATIVNDTSGTFSIIPDGSTGFCMLRPALSDPLGLMVSDSAVPPSYSKALWIHNITQVGALMGGIGSANAPDLGAHALSVEAADDGQVTFLAYHGTGRSTRYMIRGIQNAVNGADWHHVAVTFNNETLEFLLYLNGTLLNDVERVTPSTFVWPGGKQTQIGEAETFGVGNYGAAACFADMALYDGVLTPAQVNILYTYRYFQGYDVTDFELDF